MRYSKRSIAVVQRTCYRVPSRRRGEAKAQAKKGGWEKRQGSLSAATAQRFESEFVSVKGLGGHGGRLRVNHFADTSIRSFR